MTWPASGPGRLLERNGDVAPRGMTVQDRTRLIGRLRHLQLPRELARGPHDVARVGTGRCPRVTRCCARRNDRPAHYPARRPAPHIATRSIDAGARQWARATMRSRTPRSLLFRWQEGIGETVGSRAVATGPWRHETPWLVPQESCLDAHPLPGSCNNAIAWCFRPLLAEARTYRVVRCNFRLF